MKIGMGNILSSRCSVLVNPVNCVGVMGKGLALNFKKKYPAMYNDYVAKCKNNEVHPGMPYLYKDTRKSILNFPTKDDWRNPSEISYIISGLDWFRANYKELGIIDSIAFPALGCGNGGLLWDNVGPLMYTKLNDLPIYIEVYAPYNTDPWKLSEDWLSASEEDRRRMNIGIEDGWLKYN